MRYPPLITWLIMAGSLYLHAAEPVTTRSDAVGRTLNQAFAEGKCAGLAAIQYENRDGNHSPLEPGIYPQLKIYKPTTAEGTNTGMATALREQPTLMNCSMASHDIRVGSLARSYLHVQDGYSFLTAQYLGNQLSIYPEHRDHDAGINGVGGGYGDLFPANLPMLLISQGSSGSDQPFLRALLATTAAFSPEVQMRLIKAKLLAPTLQAILRSSSPLLKKEQDYFTALAHPPVFTTAHLDELAMVNRARLMTPNSIPPLAVLEILEETPAKPGSDFFEAPGIKSDSLGTVPTCIARVYRSTADGYRIRLSGKRSVDPERRPLRLSWHVLQGDPRYVELKQEEGGATASIRVRWHKLPASAAGLQTHRVEVALIASSAFSHSAPAIFSLYMPAHEERFYDADARLSEVCYSRTSEQLGLPTSLDDIRWVSLFTTLANPDPSPLQQLLDRVFTTPQRVHATKSAKEIISQKENWISLMVEQAPPEAKTRASQVLQQVLTPALTTTLEDKDGKTKSFRDIAERALNSIADFYQLYPALQDHVAAYASRSPKESAQADITSMVRRLQSWSVLRSSTQAGLEIVEPEETASAAVRSYIRQLNLTLLSQALLPELLERSPATLTVDPRISQPKPWRDVLRYDGKGQRTGWTRYQNGQRYEFTLSGQLIEKSGPRSVTYKSQDGQILWE